MRRSLRLADAAAAGAAGGLALRALAVGALGGEPIPLRVVALAAGAVGVAVAWALLARRPARRAGGLREVLIAAPSLVVPGLAFAVDHGEWTPLTSGAFAAVAAAAVLTVVALGRSFAVLPARGVLVTAGPYRLVRHPLYACELALVALWALSVEPRLGLATLAVATFATAARIGTEERLLAEDPGWRRYATGVRHRIIPGLW